MGVIAVFTNYEDYSNIEIEDIEIEGEDLEVKTALQSKKKWIVTQPRKASFGAKNIVKSINATDFAKQIKLPKENEQITCVVSGHFVFGEILSKMQPQFGRINCLTISTLSMSDDNVDMLAQMIVDGQLDHVNILVSAFWHAHERNGTYKRILDSIHPENLKLGVANVHTKIMCIDCDAGLFVISGSANLRSSASYECFDLINNQYLHDWHTIWMMQLIDSFGVIKRNKPPTFKEQNKIMGF